MKFKRILAALLSCLMIASVMSFSAFVSAAQNGVVKEFVLKTDNYLNRAQSVTPMFDQETGIGYIRAVPYATDHSESIKACYVNIGGQNIMPTAEQCENGLWIVFNVRTNMVQDENDICTLDMYSSSFGTAENNVAVNGAAGTIIKDNENFVTFPEEEWGKVCFKLTTKANVTLNGAASATTENLYKWDQVAFFPGGAAATKTIKEWWTSVPEGETPHVDFAGYAIVDSLEAAENYDFTQSARASVNLTFDKGYTADDDTDVETQINVAKASWSGGTVVFPELTPPTEGHDFVGWYTDADFTNKIEDITAVPVPEIDTTYYALFAERIIKGRTWHIKYKAERGQESEWKYDEETDIVYTRMAPTTNPDNSARSCYVNISGQNISIPKAVAEACEVYAVFYARTNMTMDDNDKPELMQYQCLWGDSSDNQLHSPAATLVTDGFASKLGNQWQKFCFKLVTKANLDIDKDGVKADEYLTKVDQLAFLAAGSASTKPISEWFTSVPEGVTPYVDCAGYAVVTSLEAAENYDFIANAKAPKVEITFDKGIADDDSDVEKVTYVSGHYIADTVEFPEIEAPGEGYEFIGWYEDAGYTKAVDAENAAVPETNKTYYALWQENLVEPEFAIESIRVNETFDVTEFSLEGVTINLPYGWAELEKFGVAPTVAVTAVAPAAAEFVAGDTLADGGKIILSQDKFSKEVPVTFVIADAPEAKTSGTDKITAGVYSTSGVITLPDGSEINKDSTVRGVGLVPEKNVTHYGVNANKFTPVYKGSALDGTKVSATEYYTHNRSVNLEGYNTLGNFDFESYNVYRALVYYDTGADGKFDIEVNPKVWYQGSLTTGTMSSNATARKSPLVNVAGLKGNRWEYIYFTKTDVNKVLYGKAVQPVFSFFANNDGTKAKDFTDDVFYFAEVTILPELNEFVQYKPTTLAAVAVNDGVPGSVTGITDDMEMLVDDEWVAITGIEGYADGILAGLEAGEYTFRYAATEKLLASEASTVKVVDSDVYIRFDAQNGQPVTMAGYDINADIVPPSNPEKDGYSFKGWSETVGGEVVNLSGLKATEDKTYYAVWEKIEVMYVKGSAETSGDGLTAETPVKTLAEAAEIIYNNGGTIVIMDDVAWGKSINGKGDYNYVNADTVITSVDPKTGTDYPGALVQTLPINFSGNIDAKITLRNIEIASWRAGKASDVWQYINFRGHPVELDNVRARTGNVPEGYSVGETNAAHTSTDSNGKKIVEIYLPLYMRAQGEGDAYGKGNKIRYGDTDFSSSILAGKRAYTEGNGWYKSDIDFEYFGNNKTKLSLGNDSSTKTIEGDPKKYYHYGRLGDVKLLFETAPKSIIFTNISGIEGAMRVIANNGIKINVPAFVYSREEDVTTNADGTSFTADITPKGGYWKINSAVGGRVDFTDETNVFAVTTDAEYIIVTNKEDDTYRRIRVSDGVEGDANLFGEDGVYLLALEEGEYDITYTDEKVKINVLFDNGDADEVYVLDAIGQSATYTGTVRVPAGYEFDGWKNDDGTIVISGNTYTVNEFQASKIVFTPAFKRITSVPYYFSKGIYNGNKGTYDVTVYIANGRYTLGTLGLQYDKTALTYKDYTLGATVENYIGDTPEIVKDNMNTDSGNTLVLLWNAKKEAVDASLNDVEIVTLHFEINDKAAFDEKFGSNTPAVTPFYPSKDYKRYFENGSYKVVRAPEAGGDEYSVNYVDVSYGHHEDEHAFVIKVNIKSKEGATASNIAYLAYSPAGTNNWKFVALEEAGNEDEIEKSVVGVFTPGEWYDIKILKNGYIGYASNNVRITEGFVLETELIGGDIKGSATGSDENAVDFDDFGDGKVDISDFVRVLRAFDENSSPAFRSTVDVNEDDAVTVADLAIIKANYLKSDYNYKISDGEAMVAQLDEVEEQRIDAIRNTENKYTSAERIIYVSSSEGDDANDGLTEQTPVSSIARANMLVRTKGIDTVLLKRGDIWREVVEAVAGTTYSSYGAGAKPRIYGSPENGADENKWTLVYQNEDTGALIWKYAREDFLDVGTLVFNDGEGFAMKEVPSCVGDVYYVRGQENLPEEERTPFDYTVELDKNLEFFHQANSKTTSKTGIGEYIDIGSATGPLYLRCDNGNPGKVFDSIEFNTRTSGIYIRTNNNVTIDNICIMYAGIHGIAAGTVKNLTVTNCEIGWIGGSIQGYDANLNTKRTATRLGNGVEIYGGCDGYLIDNCYIYQCYDAGVTHQLSTFTEVDCSMNNVTYSNNVITECVYSIEYFLNTDKTGVTERNGDNILFDSNLLRRAGYGFGSFRPNGNNQRHIRSGSNDNPFTNFVIKNNIFDRSVYELLCTFTDREEWTPYLDGNVYIQGVDNGFYHFADKGNSKFTLNAEKLVKNVLGDVHGKVYFVENIPYWNYDYEPSVSYPVE